jgi:hypothetical protein
VVRASVGAEMAAIGTVSLVGDGFEAYARAIARRLGIPDLGLAVFPGVIMTEPEADLRAGVRDGLVDQVVAALLAPPPARPDAVAVSSADPRQEVFAGDLDSVQEHFEERLWSDGLPIMPPTRDRVDRFLAETPRSWDEVLGVLPPDNREATIWNVAVNGVMAGCRPELMPLLVAAVEALADPSFRLEYAGGTPGWEALPIVGGPAVKRLDFNFEAGVMRTGRRANTSLARFVRLYMRNVAGLRIPPGDTDKATIGFSLMSALAENEEAVRAIGWPTFAEEQGFAAGEDVVTLISVQGVSSAVYSGGTSAAEHARTLTESIGEGLWAHKAWTGLWFGQYHPLLVLTPSVAEVFARDGWAKDDLRRHFAEHVTVTAESLERYAYQTGTTEFNLRRLVEEGRIPALYAAGADPERRVPAFPDPASIRIVVAGDRSVNQARGYVQNHRQGPPVSKRALSRG